MALEVFWSTRASKKFDKIINYLNNEWGDKASKTFTKKVYDFIDLLAEFPEIGAFQDKEKEIQGFVVIKQITVYYRVDKNKLILLNFFDNRQNPKKKRF